MKTMVKLTALFFLLSWTTAVRGELVDRIVAIVNDDAITLSELEEQMAPFVQKVRMSLRTPEEEQRILFKMREEVLDRMIEKTLTDQESKRLGISVTDLEVDKRIETIKSQNFFTDEDLKRALAAQGITLDEYRGRIKEQILQNKIISIEVKSKVAITEAEIQDYYKKNQDRYLGKTQYQLRSILVKVPSWDNSDEHRAALKKVEVILEKLQYVDFQDVAKEYSEDISAQNGGDLGRFSLDELTPELQETLRWMKEGDISPALQTPQGYQILFVEKIIGSSEKTDDHIKMEIQDKLFMEKAEKQYKAWLDALRKRSFIKKKL